METFELMEYTLRYWVKKDLGRYVDVDKLFRNFSIISNGFKKESSGRLYLWTSRNRYSISFHPSDSGGYLGCIAVSRIWRAGEDWNRGNDLADGNFNEGTWRKIISDIVSYELEVPVVPKPQIAVPESSRLLTNP